MKDRRFTSSVFIASRDTLEKPIALAIAIRPTNLKPFFPAAPTGNLHNQMNMNPSYLRRPYRGGMGSSYPSTATSGLLSNQSQNGGNPGRNERISPRSSMWHSSYNDNWRPAVGAPNFDMAARGGGRRVLPPRFWLRNRNQPGNRYERRAHYSNPGVAPEIIFVENGRGGGLPPRRNIDRLQPYGTPRRSPDILFVENVRPAHRQPQGAFALFSEKTYN